MAFVMRMVQIKPIATKRKYQKHIAETEEWAEEHEMTFAGFFRFCGAPFAVWYHADRSLFLVNFCESRHGSHQLEARFSDDVTLRTINTTDDLMPLGTYQQLFPGLQLDELWKRHQEAERYLIEQCGVVFTPRLPDLDWPEADDINTRRMTDVTLHTEMLDRANANPFAVLYDDDDENESPLRGSDSQSQASVRLVQQHLRRHFRAKSRYWIGLFQWRWLFWGYWAFIDYWFVRNRSVEQLIENGRYKRPQDLPNNYRQWY